MSVDLSLSDSRYPCSSSKTETRCQRTADRIKPHLPTNCDQRNTGLITAPLVKLCAIAWGPRHVSIGYEKAFPHWEAVSSGFEQCLPDLDTPRYNLEFDRQRSDNIIILLGLDSRRRPLLERFIVKLERTQLLIYSTVNTRFGTHLGSIVPYNLIYHEEWDAWWSELTVMEFLSSFPRLQVVNIILTQVPLSKPTTCSLQLAYS